MARGGKMVDVDWELIDIMENMSIGMLKHIFRSPELKVQVGFSNSLPSSVVRIVANYRKIIAEGSKSATINSKFDHR